MRPADDRSADFRERIPTGSARRRLSIPPVLDQKVRMNRRDRGMLAARGNPCEETLPQFKLAHVHHPSVHKDQRLAIFDARK